MKNFFVLLTALTATLWGQTLQMLYAQIDQSPEALARYDEILMQTQKERGDSMVGGWSLGGYAGFADPKGDVSSKREFGAGIAKEIDLTLGKRSDYLNALQSRGNLGKKIVAARIKSRLFDLAGNYCIESEALESKTKLLQNYRRIHAGIEEGVKYGEFDTSKAILSQLAIRNLQMEVIALQSSIDTLESKIKAMVDLPEPLACPVELPGFSGLTDPGNSLLHTYYMQQERAAKANLAMSRDLFPAAQVGLEYSDEIDTRRAMLTVQVPLSLGGRAESDKALAMYGRQKALHEVQRLGRAFKSDAANLKHQMRLLNTTLNIQKGEMDIATLDLIVQSQQRFEAGEENIIALLKAAEQRQALIQNTVDTKRKRHQLISDFLTTYAIDPQGDKQ